MCRARPYPVLPASIAALTAVLHIAPVAGQGTPPAPAEERAGPFRVHLSGGLAHQDKGTGLSAGLGGSGILGRGPGLRDPKGPRQALARVGGEFLEVGAVPSFRPWRSRGEDRESTVESIPRPLLVGVEPTR